MKLKDIRKYSFFFCCLLFISSCASVSPTELANAYFGTIPSNYKCDIKKLMARQLKDPYSAKYTFEEPRKGMCKDGLLLGGEKHYGYIVPVTINAKNSYGGYTGNELHYFFFSEGRFGDATSLLSSGMAMFLE